MHHTQSFYIMICWIHVQYLNNGQQRLDFDFFFTCDFYLAPHMNSHLIIFFWHEIIEYI